MCCAAARGSTTAGSAGLLLVTTAVLLFAATTLVSGLPEVCELCSVKLSVLFAGQQQTGSQPTWEAGGRAGDDRRGYGREFSRVSMQVS